MDNLSKPTNNNINNGADIFLLFSIIICLSYFCITESISFGFLFTILWLSFSWFFYKIYIYLLFLWMLAAGFLLGSMVFFLLPDVLNYVFGRFGDLGSPFNFDPDIMSFNPDHILLLGLLILYFFIVWFFGKTEDLKISGACVFVGAVIPIFLPVKLLLPYIAGIVLAGLVYISGIVFLSSIPIISIWSVLYIFGKWLGLYMYENWHIIIIIILILGSLILLIKFTAKFLIAYVVCAAVGFIVLSYTQEVFFYGKIFIQSASLIQQITTNIESLSELFSVLLKIVKDSSILNLDIYDLLNLFIKPYADKFIILLSSLFYHGRFQFIKARQMAKELKEGGGGGRAKGGLKDMFGGNIPSLHQ